MEPNITAIAGTTGGAAAAGGITGFAVKKLLKLIAVLIGMEFAFLAFLERMEFITVKWPALNEAANSFLETVTTMSIPASTSVPEIAASGGAVGGFGGGFYLGFQRG